MIFATVGTQLPFPRLLDALQEASSHVDEKIVAQSGPCSGTWPGLELHEKLDPKAFDTTFRNARLVVAHAGIGTLLSAQRFNKPLIVLPRRADLGEHRNDHQLATARQIERTPGVYVAWDASDLLPMLKRQDLEPARHDDSDAKAALVTRLASFLNAPK